MLILFVREDDTVGSFETEIDLDSCSLEEMPPPLNDPNITQWFTCHDVRCALDEISQLKQKIEILRAYVEKNT